MRFTKDDKVIYNFLKAVHYVFKNSNNRTTLMGKGGKLYFYTFGYMGLLEVNEELTQELYNFGKDKLFTHYELKLDPKNNFILDVIPEALYSSEIDHIVNKIEDANKNGGFVTDFSKSDNSKIAKIALMGEVAVLDKDIKLLDTFTDSEVFIINDTIVLKSLDDPESNINQMLAIDCEHGASTQTKIDFEQIQKQKVIEQEIQETVKELTEEIKEDDFDPMDM